MIRGLKWIGSLERYETIITENPLDEIWHLIDFLTAEETIAKCDPPVDKDLVPFLCESIEQSQEFRKSAAVSGEHTKPLLIYYCVHNLTKAMLALETNKKPVGYHGLMKVEVPANGNLLGISAQVNEGVFWGLLHFNKIKPVKHLKVSVDDLLKSCGYLVREYHYAYEKVSDILLPELEEDMGLNALELSINKPDNDFDNRWEELLPKLPKYFELSESKDNLLILKLKDNIPKGNLENIRKVLDDVLIYSVFNHPSYFLLPRKDPNLFWPQDAFLYALSFILGSLVRYYPDYWYQHIISNKRNRWTIRSINSVVERVYPNLMINIMYNYKIHKFLSAPSI
jgi:hypothetical protein